MQLEGTVNLSPEEFELISQMVYKHCGIHLTDGKQELVQARLAKRLRLGRHKNIRDYLQVVQNDPNEFSQLIDALSTNLTSFFRESNHFDFVTQRYLPTLLARKRRTGKNRLRFWSAACSTGEEPYTLAMVSLDALEGQGAWDLKILATDISTRVLKTAQSGFYPHDRVDKIPPAYRQKYFRPGQREGQQGYQVVPTVSSLVRFNYLNLMDQWPFSGPLDLIFCRNVMIYFDKPTQQRLINRFHQVLDEGGLLFTGHSESLTGISHPFNYVQPTIYVKGSL